MNSHLRKLQIQVGSLVVAAGRLDVRKCEFTPENKPKKTHTHTKS